MSALEERFLLSLRAHRLAMPLREFRFARDRDWRLDFAWPAAWLAVELEGVFGGGTSRHTTATGYSGDCDKYNAAAEAGWTVLRYTAQQVQSGDGAAQVERMLVERLGEAAHVQPAGRPAERARRTRERVQVGGVEATVVAEWRR
jgi:very-short-patch-repair endonuclease